MYNLKLPPGAFIDETGDLLLRLRSSEQARASLRRCSLKHAARVLRKLGYDGAAHALELANVPEANEEF